MSNAPAPLEVLAQEYAQAVENRRALTAGLRRMILRLTDEIAPAIREAVGAEAGCKAALEHGIADNPELFVRPRTVVAHGIKYGFQMLKGRIEIPDEADTIRRIESSVPPEQAALLIRVTKAIHKPAVLDLSAGDLRRLRIIQHPGEDQIVVKPVSDAADKLVAAVLTEAEARIEEAA
jgi:hypothetical protein